MKLLVVFFTTLIFGFAQAELDSQEAQMAGAAAYIGAHLKGSNTQWEINQTQRNHTTVIRPNRVLTLDEQLQLTRQMEPGAVVNVRILLSVEETRKRRAAALDQSIARMRENKSFLNREIPRLKAIALSNQSTVFEARKALSDIREAEKKIEDLTQKIQTSENAKLKVLEQPDYDVQRKTEVRAFEVGKNGSPDFQTFMQETTARGASVQSVARFSAKGRRLVAMRSAAGQLGLVVMAATAGAVGAATAAPMLHDRFVRENEDVIEEYEVER